MPENRILIFSSSRAGTGEYLQTAIPVIKSFLGEAAVRIAFLPFAAIGYDYDVYGSQVKKAFKNTPYIIETVTSGNAKQVIETAGVIMVGGGNTFKLLHDLYDLQLTDIIRDRINNGAAYIGWSAGSNITGPSIGTTNDMPVIEPQSFAALGLFPFQINPHYINAGSEGHHGETRNQRLQEFIQLHPELRIVALPEGTALQLKDQVLKFIGTIPGKLFYTEAGNKEMAEREIFSDDDLFFLL